MDTSPSGAGAGHERRSSIGAMFKRMKTVLRRGSSSNAGSPAIAATAGECESEALSTVQIAPQVQAPEPSEPMDVPTAVPQPTNNAVSTSVAEPMSTPLDPDLVVEPIMDESPTYAGFHVNSLEQQDRARLLFARYGLSFDQEDFISIAPTITAQRVERPIRMRIHRSCHRCKTTFGVDRSCKNCEHKRCKRCPRYPALKPTEGSRAVKEANPPKPESDVEKLRQKRREPLMVKRPSDTHEMLYQHLRQRMKRVCHKCATSIPPTATVCAECKHVRCSKCPRQPAKLEKFAHGYPGDVSGEDSDTDSRLRYPYISGSAPTRMYRKPRIRVRWICEQCNTTFKRPGSTCEQCRHEQCSNCTRIPAKIKKEPDPEVMDSLTAKLAQLQVEKSTEEWVQSTLS